MSATYVRKPANPFSAGVLRGEVSRFAGEWERLCAACTCSADARGEDCTDTTCRCHEDDDAA